MKTFGYVVRRPTKVVYGHHTRPMLLNDETKLWSACWAMSPSLVCQFIHSNNCLHIWNFWALSHDNTLPFHVFTPWRENQLCWKLLSRDCRTGKPWYMLWKPWYTLWKLWYPNYFCFFQWWWLVNTYSGLTGRGGGRCVVIVVVVKVASVTHSLGFA